MTSPSEEKEPIARVRLDSIFPAKIIDFLKKRGREEKLFVTDESGDQRFELVLNMHQELSFMDGKNKRMVEGCGIKLYLDGESIERIDQASVVDDSLRFESVKEKTAVSEITDDLIKGLNAFLESGTRKPVQKAPEPEFAVTPEIIRKAAPTRLRSVLDLIVQANGDFKIYFDSERGCQRISSSDKGNSTRLLAVLAPMCREMELKNGKLDVYLSYSREEEKIAQEAGYKLTVVYN